MSTSADSLERLLREIKPGWALQGMEPLGGRACALHMSDGGLRSERLVMLSHGPRDRERNPHIARDEYRLLKILSQARLPAPQALGLGEGGEPPFLITNFAAGSSELHEQDAPALGPKLAEILYDIHSIDLETFDLSFLPRANNLIDSDMAPSSPAQPAIQAALRRARPHIKRNKSTLLHGDFWLGNLLWQAGELTAIIDWEDAMIGDPLADLGKSRLELLWALGREAMDGYTARYLHLNRELDSGSLAYWDLWGASRLSHFARFAADARDIPRMRAQYEAFVADALQRLQTAQE